MDLTIEVFTGAYQQANILTTITDADIVLEEFEHWASVCQNSEYTVGGCVASWLRFTTTKLTYSNGGVNTPIPWKSVKLNVVLTDGADTHYLGVYFPSEYTEQSNHTQVRVLAYDAMYRLRNADMTTWYENYAAANPSGSKVLTFWNAFAAELVSRGLIDYYAYPLSIASTLLNWLPYVPATGEDTTRPLLSGTITAGKLLNDISVACVCNAYIKGVQNGSVLLDFFILLASANENIALTDYTEFEYDSKQNDAYTNVRIGAYNEIYDANNSTDKVLGLNNNFIFDSNVFVSSGGGDPVNTQLARNILLNINNADVYRPGTITMFHDKFLDFNTYLKVTGTDGNVYTVRPMQREVKGLKAMLITYTSLPTADLFETTDFQVQNEYGEYITDMTGKLDRQAGSAANNVSWDLSPTLWEIKHSGSDVLKINGSGLSIDAVSIKKNGTELVIPTKLSDLTDDVVSGHYVKLSSTGIQTISVGSGATVVIIKSAQTGSGAASLLGFAEAGGQWLGFIGMEKDKPIVYYSDGSTKKAIALLDDVVKKSGNDTITATSGIGLTINANSGAYGYPLVVNNTDTNSNGVWIQYNFGGQAWGWIGVSPTKKPVFYDTAVHEIALADNVWALKGMTLVSPSAGSRMDLNTYTTPGNYAMPSNALATYVDNAPTSGLAFNLIVSYSLDNSSYIRQIFMNHNSQRWYARVSTNGGSTWGAWVSFALSADLDNYLLKSVSTEQIVASTSRLTPLYVKSGASSAAFIGFRDTNGAILGYLGFGASDTPNIYLSDGSTKKEIALLDEVITKSSTTAQKIALSSGSAATVLQLQSRTSATRIGFLNLSGVLLGYIGVESNNKPAFYDTASHEIALVEDVVKLSNAARQIITNTGAGRPVLVLKSNDATGAVLGFQNPSGAYLGYLGFTSDKKILFNNTVIEGTMEVPDGVASHYLAGDGTWKNGTTDSTKLPLAGGTMTGNIKWQDNTALPQQTAGTMPYFLGIDAFASGGATKWQDAANVATALSTYLVKKTTNIQKGTTSTTRGTAKAVQFGTAFAGTPVVVVSGDNLSYIPVAYNISSTGFTVSTTGTASTAPTITIQWIAYYT